jgi:hypothetical protein
VSLLGLEGMTKECLGPDCAILGLQGVSVQNTCPVPFLWSLHSDQLTIHLSCARIVLHVWVLDGSLLVLQNVSDADIFPMAIVRLTD